MVANVWQTKKRKKLDKSYVKARHVALELRGQLVIFQLPSHEFFDILHRQANIFTVKLLLY